MTIIYAILLHSSRVRKTSRFYLNKRKGRTSKCGSKKCLQVNRGNEIAQSKPTTKPKSDEMISKEILLSRVKINDHMQVGQLRQQFLLRSQYVQFLQYEEDVG